MIGRNAKGDIIFASNISEQKWREMRAKGKRLATIVVPEGYATAAEFAEDCGFELVGESEERTT